ncbi:hypothetical protein L3N51_02437 [Metallosphaera sp. J1]|uniref:ribbon-helix-helix domain-containing protein n=1 Tax=Metallosphaera javensis (ex Hofmann et al. 2022) TaxID=99938 RepID=UPI001EDDA1EB|nr:ribbon-helix-helix domain-containing protein [Metallosphaera javensis (ex Hofmann et al. 2022)]MCG3110140.1 hypothetical protein [Metallosphaera javensis (ex Hofmann et al. 2022)]
MKVRETFENDRRTIILDEDFHRVITFRIDIEVNKRLESLSARTGLTKTSLVLSMIARFLSESDAYRERILRHTDNLNTPCTIGVRMRDSLVSSLLSKLPSKYPYTVALRKIISFYMKDSE